MNNTSRWPDVPQPKKAASPARQLQYLKQLLDRGRILDIDLGSAGQPVPVVQVQRLYSHVTGAISAVEILHCPWCDCRHTHGAGPNPGDGDGHRASHCLGHPELNTGYILREDPLTDAERAGLGFLVSDTRA
jgi:hypothetical protein